LAKVIRDPALIACFLAFAVGIAIAGVGVASSISDDPKPPQHVGGGVPATASAHLPPEKQAIIDRIAATHAAAAAQAILHPELLPPVHPELYPMSTPTPTTVPSLFGTLCSSENLGVSILGENGAGGNAFKAFTIYNFGELGCDLPVIARIEGFDQQGGLLFSKEIRPSVQCQSVYCIAGIPLPLSPIAEPIESFEKMPGTVGVLTAWSSYCDAACEYSDAERVILVFGSSVSVTLPIGFRLREGDPLSVWAVFWMNVPFN
jgi:hypothetical protein